MNCQLYVCFKVLIFIVLHCRALQHANLVQLYGVCTKSRPIYIICEFMRHGKPYSHIHVRDVVQSFGEIRYLVSTQDSLTTSFYLVQIFPIYVRFKHHRYRVVEVGVRHFYVLNQF